MTQDAVIVSCVHTGLTRAFRGGFIATHGTVLGGAVAVLIFGRCCPHGHDRTDHRAPASGK